MAMNVKTLKAILKALSESNVTKYQDSEMTIEFGPGPTTELPKPFDIESYAGPDEGFVGNNSTERDDLGLSEKDYLEWSAVR